MMKIQMIMINISLLCGIHAAAQSQAGSIGINTMNPQGVLHIDGASTPATVNPSTGAVSAAEASDDVIVDEQGRIGVGLLSPQARMDLTSATPGEAIRIQDGTEGLEKLLLSDANGVGSWALLATGSWQAALYDSPLLGYSTTTGVRQFTNYTNSLISSAVQGAVSQTNGTITVPRTGKYRVTLSIYWTADNSNGRTAPYPTRAILKVNGSDRQTFNFWAGRLLDYGVMPTFINILEFNAGDILTLFTDESSLSNANNAQAVLFMVELFL